MAHGKHQYYGARHQYPARHDNPARNHYNHESMNFQEAQTSIINKSPKCLIITVIVVVVVIVAVAIVAAVLIIRDKGKELSHAFDYF